MKISYEYRKIGSKHFKEHCGTKIGNCNKIKDNFYTSDCFLENIFIRLPVTVDTKLFFRMKLRGRYDITLYKII